MSVSYADAVRSALRRWLTAVALGGLAIGCLSELDLGQAVIECDGEVCPSGLSCLSVADGRRFCVPAGTSSESPESIAPVADASLVKGPVVFSWSGVGGVSSYVLTIAADPELTEPLSGFPQTVVGLSSTTTIDSPGVYFWSVRRADSSFASEVRSFAVFDDALYVYCPAGQSCASGESVSIGSRSRPATSLARAIALAEVANASTIVIAGRGAGEAYTEEIQILRPLTILGGYSPDFSERDPDAYPTEIRSDAPVPALIYATSAPVVLDGLTLVGTGSHLESVLVLRSASNVELLNVDVRFEATALDLSQAPEELHAVLVEDSGARLAEGSLIEVRTRSPEEVSPRFVGVAGLRSELVMEDSQITLEGGSAGLGLKSSLDGSLTLLQSEVRVIPPGDPANAARQQTGVDCSEVDCTIRDSLILGGFRGLRVKEAPQALIERNVIGTRGCAVDLETGAFFFGRTCSGLTFSPSCEPGEFFALRNNVIFAEAQYAVAFDSGRPVEPQTITHNTFIATGTVMSAGVLMTQNPRADFANNIIHASPAPISACIVHSGVTPGATSMRNNLFSCEDATFTVTATSPADGITGTPVSFDELMSRDGTQFDDRECFDMGSLQTYRYSGNLQITGLQADELIRNRNEGDWRVSSSRVDLVDDSGVDTSLELCGSDEMPRDCGAVIDSIDSTPRTNPVSIGAHEYD